MTILFGTIIVGLICVAALGLTLVTTYAAEFLPTEDVTRRRLAIGSWVMVIVLLAIIAVRFVVIAE
jgi:hypothetical protein